MNSEPELVLALKPVTGTRVIAPHDFCYAAILAATVQTCGREVLVPKTGRKYYVGGFHPAKPDVYPAALDVRHGKVMLAAISKWDRFSGGRIVKCSMREFCVACARMRGGQFCRHIYKLMDDLTKVYIRVVEDGKVLIVYRIFEEIFTSEKPIRRRDNKRVDDRQTELWLSGISFSAEFETILRNAEELLSIRLDVIMNIRHPLAQAAYWYIPAAASHFQPGGEPYKIGLATLCKQVAYNLPSSRKHQLRLLEGCKGRTTSLIGDLDGRETNTGTLQCSFRENKDGEFILLFWVAPRKTPVEAAEDMGQMKKAFLEVGHTEQQLAQRIRNRGPLSNFHRGILQKAGVQLEKAECALELARCLMGEGAFNSTISECMQAVTQNWPIGGKPIENPTGFVINECLRYIKSDRPKSESPISIKTKAVPRKAKETPSAEDVQWHKASAEFLQLDETTKNQFLQLADQEANEIDRSILDRGDTSSAQHLQRLATYRFLQVNRR